MSKLTAKKYHLYTDSEGALVLTGEFVQAAGVKTDDEFAVWKEGNGFRLVFLKSYRGKEKIPKHAHRGKLEPALPEIPVTLPKPGTLDHQQACKDLMAIGPVRFKSRKPPKKKPKAPWAKHAEEMT